MAKRPLENDRVRGLYFDQPFTGRVIAYRPHTINYNLNLTTIESDQDVIVAGKAKRTFVIETDALPGERDAYGCLIELEPEGPLDFPWWLAIEPEMAASLGLTS